jgi:hypothetical protein
MKSIALLNETDQKLVEGLYDMSIKQLVRDRKYDPNQMVLIAPDDGLHIIAGSFSGTDYGYSKDHFAFHCKKIAKDINARLSVFFSEIWVKSVDKDSADDQRGKSLANDPEAKDAMLMLIELPGRKYINCITPFDKDADGNIVMNEMRVQETSEASGRFVGILS